MRLLNWLPFPVKVICKPSRPKSFFQDAAETSGGVLTQGRKMRHVELEGKCFKLIKLQDSSYA